MLGLVGLAALDQLGDGGQRRILVLRHVLKEGVVIVADPAQRHVPPGEFDQRGAHLLRETEADQARRRAGEPA